MLTVAFVVQVRALNGTKDNSSRQQLTLHLASIPDAYEEPQVYADFAAFGSIQVVWCCFASGVYLFLQPCRPFNTLHSLSFFVARPPEEPKARDAVPLYVEPLQRKFSTSLDKLELLPKANSFIKTTPPTNKPR